MERQSPKGKGKGRGANRQGAAPGGRATPVDARTTAQTALSIDEQQQEGGEGLEQPPLGAVVGSDEQVVGIPVDYDLNE